MLTLTDLFCGAGGSSTGAIAVPGVQVRMAANHWQLAVDTHNTNHPTTDHAAADIHQADPRFFPRTDILWASPECTKWSVAQGKRAADIDPGLWEDPLSDEAAQRSRMLMFDVPRFAEHHRYRAIIVENVVDIATQTRYLGAFDRWLHSMHGLGYEHREVYLNSMHAQAAGLPAPQSRDRIYIVFWRAGDRAPDIDRWTRPQAWCPDHGWITAMQAWKNPAKRRGRYRAQYVWRCPRSECRHRVVEPGWLPAASIIDWSNLGQRIGDRVKPLSPKTIARIRAGLDRYAREPFMVSQRFEYRHRSLQRPAPTMTAQGTHLGLVTPFLAEAAGHTFERRPGVRTRPIDGPLGTQTTTATTALIVPVEGRNGVNARPSSEPMRTATARLQDGLVVMLRGENRAKSTDEPLDTFAAAGLHHALIMRNNSSRSGEGAEMVTPATEPFRTLTTTGHQSLLIYDFNGPVRDARVPLPTQTTVEGNAALSPAVEVDDCLFRMLEPAEIKRGMAFPAEYVLLGNRREQVRMAGNAVTPPAARDLVAAVAEALS